MTTQEIKQGIYELTQWVVFEPSNPSVWSRVIRQVSDYLKDLWSRERLGAATHAKSYYVRCDEVLNPDAVRKRGQTVIEVGLVPPDTESFEIIRIIHAVD
jgi:uncharacterized protein